MLKCLDQYQRHFPCLSMLITESQPNQDHADIQRILHAQQKRIEVLSEVLKDKDALISQLKDALKLAYARKYGRSAERYTDPNQTSLFDEAELEALAEEGKTFDNDSGEEVEVKTHSRKKKRGKRKPLPDYLPRETIEH